MQMQVSQILSQSAASGWAADRRAAAAATAAAARQRSASPTKPTPGWQSPERGRSPSRWPHGFVASDPTTGGDHLADSGGGGGGGRFRSLTRTGCHREPWRPPGPSGQHQHRSGGPGTEAAATSSGLMPRNLQQAFAAAAAGAGAAADDGPAPGLPAVRRGGEQRHGSSRPCSPQRQRAAEHGGVAAEPDSSTWAHALQASRPELYFRQM